MKKYNIILNRSVYPKEALTLGCLYAQMKKININIIMLLVLALAMILALLGVV